MRKDDSVNYPRLFPKVPIRTFSLPFSKLGKGAIGKKYWRICSTHFFIPLLLGGIGIICRQSFQNLLFLPLALTVASE